MQKGQTYIKGENEFLLYNQLAKFYLRKKDYKQALEYSDKAFESPHLEKEFIETRISILNANPNKDAQSIINYNTIFFEYDFAKDLQSNIPSWFNDNGQQTTEIYDLFDNSESWIKVLKSLSEADETFAQSPYMSLIIKAKYEVALGYYDDAFSHIQKALEYCNNNEQKFPLYIGELEIYQALEKFGKMVALINKLLEIYHENEEIIPLYTTRAMCYAKLKKYDLAFQDVDRLEELINNPNNIKFLEFKGKILIECEKYYDALNLFLKISEKNNKFKLSNDILKKVVNSTNSYDLAIKAINRLGEGKVYSDTEMVDLIDSTLIENNQYKRAITELRKIESRNKKLSTLYYSLGICYDNLNSKQTALLYYNKAMSFKGFDENLYLSRADVYIKLKKYKEAFTDIKKYEKINYGDARIEEALYQIYMGLENYQRALYYLNRITSNGNSFASLQEEYDLAFIKKKLGDSYGAFIILNDLIEDSLRLNAPSMYTKAIKLKNSLYW